MHPLEPQSRARAATPWRQEPGQRAKRPRRRDVEVGLSEAQRASAGAPSTARCRGSKDLEEEEPREDRPLPAFNGRSRYRPERGAKPEPQKAHGTGGGDTEQLRTGSILRGEICVARRVWARCLARTRSARAASGSQRHRPRCQNAANPRIGSGMQQAHDSFSPARAGRAAP